MNRCKDSKKSLDMFIKILKKNKLIISVEIDSCGYYYFINFIHDDIEYCISDEDDIDALDDYCYDFKKAMKEKNR